MAQRLLDIRPLQADSAADAVRVILNDVNLGYSNGSDVIQVYGQDAINNMINNILLTVPGERHYEPLFGSMLPYLLWEPMDDITAYKLETATFDALKFWMPYIQLNYRLCKITPNYDQQLYDVYMPWTDIFTNSAGVYSEQLQRGGAI